MKVVGLKRDSDGDTIRTQNKNPFLLYRVYNTKFEDGTFYEYAPYLIMKNMYA